MKTAGQFVLLIILVAIVASASCVLTGHYLRHDEAAQQRDFHHWLHEQLDLTPDQNRALDAQEAQFSAKKKDLIGELQDANAALAQALVKDREYSPQVQAAVERIHHAQSNLEKATLEHIFDMKPILTPAQFDKVLHLTETTLNTPPQP